MSFLYDPEVMMQLVKAAFDKEAQSAALQAKQQQIKQNADAMDPAAVAAAVNSGAVQSQKADELKGKLNPQQNVAQPDQSLIANQNALAKKLVARLSKEFPSGAPSSATSPTDSTQKPGGFNPNNAVQELPLSREDIDFNRINRFFEEIKKYQIPNDPKNPEAIKRGTAFKTSTDSAINRATNFMGSALEKNNNNNIFSMSDLPEDFARNVPQPKGTNFIGLTNDLLNVLNEAANVMRQLKSAYPQLKQSIEDQIGVGPTDDSIYRNNADRLKFLQSKVSFVK